MTMRLACLLAPGPQTVEHARLAEALGYDRVWLADSPALWQDIWARMALVAEHTHRIQLGTAVLIPSLRHVVTQAAAIATIADIAPGRLTVGLATGFTGRAALGQHKRLPWAVVKRYVQQLRGLLHGEQVEVDGALCQLIPSAGFMPPRPITVPIFLAASGPRGYQVAREVADGIINPGRPPGTDFPECIQSAWGTVLADGEALTAPRVRAAAGAAVALRYHLAYEYGGRARRRSAQRSCLAGAHRTAAGSHPPSGGTLWPLRRAERARRRLHRHDSGETALVHGDGRRATRAPCHHGSAGGDRGDVRGDGRRRAAGAAGVPDRRWRCAEHTRGVGAGAHAGVGRKLPSLPAEVAAHRGRSALRPDTNKKETICRNSG